MHNACACISPIPFHLMTQRLLAFAFGLLCLATFGNAQHLPLLLKDINTTPASFGSYNMDPAGFVQMNGITYYTAYTANSRRQLWRTDGSSAGTRALTNNPDLTWEINSSTFEIPASLTPMNGNLYFFTANKEPGGANRFNLVRSDASGNTMRLASSSTQFSFTLTQIMLTQSSPFSGDATRKKMVALGNNVYFAFSDNTHGIELWKSDGTAAGTAMLKDITAGPQSSSPMNFAVAGNNVFFTVTNPDTYISLWKTDGSTAGTVRLKDSVAASRLKHFTAVGSTLYFLGYDENKDEGNLWKSDGTAAGTISADKAGTSTIVWGRSQLMKQGNNVIYTFGSGPMKKYDGSSSSSLSSAALPLNPMGRSNHWADVNGTLYFAGQNISNSQAGLWKTDGTTAGTVPVKEGLTSLNYLNANGTLYFAGDDNSAEGMELWKSDGSEAGTVRLSDFNTNRLSVSGDGIIDLTTDYTMVYQGGKVILGGFNGISSLVGTNSLLAASDGTVAGTGFVAPADASNYGSYPAARKVWNDQLYFSAFAPATGSELWKTDGTPGGTVMLSDLNPGTASSYIQAFTPYNGSLYFLTSDTANGLLRDALWKTDGTAAGTIKVKDSLGHAYYGNCKMGVSGSVLFITAGGSVYVSDGTTAGTINVPIRFTGAPIESIAANFAFLNSNTAIVSALNNVSGTGANELWNVDLALKTATRYSVGQMQHTEMQAFDGSVYIVRQQNSSPSSEFVLWKTNGTTAGTSIANLTVNPHYLSVMNGGADLYYVGTDALRITSNIMRIPAGGAPVVVQSWNDQKTASFAYDNTYRYYWLQEPQVLNEYIHNVYPESYSYFTQPAAGGPIFLPAGDAASGIELFITNQSTGVTAMVRNIAADSFSGGPQYLTPIVNKGGDTILAFVANDGVHGAEIWVSDGTAGGTQSFANSLPGSSSLNPKYLTWLNGKLIFWGTSLEYGMEPYVYELQQLLKAGKENLAAGKLLLYPNPADQTISIGAAIGSRIEVFSMSGTRVLEAAASSTVTVLPVGSLTPGMYLVRVQAKVGEQSARFIKL